MLEVDSNFQITYFFNSRQQKAFNDLDYRIQDRFRSRFLLSENPQDLELVRLTLDISVCCSDHPKRFIDLFFQTVLDAHTNEINIHETLAKVKKICQIIGGAKAFFTCASTKKIEYYSLETLKEITDLFCESLLSGSGSIPNSFCDIPCYDEGGRGVLINLIKQPLANKKITLCTFSEPKRQSVNFKELLKKKNSYKNICSVATAYLKSLPETNRLKMDIYHQFFFFLGNNLQITELSDYEKTCLIKIVLISSSSHEFPVPQYYSFIDLTELVEEAIKVHNNCGEEVLIDYSEGICRQSGVYLETAKQGLSFLHALSQDFEKIIDVQICLENFQKQKLQLPEFIMKLEEMVSDFPPPPAGSFDIEELLRRLSGEDPNVKFPLAKKKRDLVRKRLLRIQDHCEEWKTCKMSELVNKALEIQKKTIHEEIDLVQLMAIGRLALRIKFFPIYLHATQLVTVLGLLAHENGALAQVKTGEGKSLIVALLTFVLTMQKKDIHVISSSPSLAMRDQRDFCSFFKTFGVTSSHICRSEKKPEDFDAQVLYGVTSDYEFAIMEEILYFSKIFSRKFENTCGIVDEVDNLTIDTALNGARMGYPAEVTHGWVYLPIFNFLKQNISKDECHKLAAAKTLVSLKAFLKNYRGGQFSTYVDGFSDYKLNKWLTSAFRAFHILTEKNDYVVQFKTTEGHIQQEISIVDDGNTGKIMNGTRWSGGTHEFVEVKHQIANKDETIVPISMSHPVYYPLYPTIYGLTGTLGADSEREEIKKIYGIDSFDIPTNKPMLRIDAPPTILSNNLQHTKAIIDKIKAYQQHGRPILVICKTIQITEELEKQLKALNIPHEILNEIQQKSEEEILENAGLPGAVTISTNNAGRGTDIKLKGNSRANGGLHVLITFYPASQRVEEQLRGRAGRQGEPGSSEILLSKEMLMSQKKSTLSSSNKMDLLEQLNDARVKHGNMLKHLHICRADIERFSFSLAKIFYKKLRKFNKLIEDDRFLGECSANLKNRLLNKKTFDFSSLLPTDRLLAETVLKLFHQPDSKPIHWFLLLQQTIKRLNEKMINDWATIFHDQVEDMINDFKIENLDSIKDEIDQLTQQLRKNGKNIEALYLGLFFANQEKQIELAVDQELSNLKKEISHLYDTHMLDWNKKLNPDGSGVIEYLSSLLGVELILIQHKTNNYES
ncbi:MAG: hypothetical protein H0T62_06315 [Parachlamydiaceae bacterium]|nr:hypothetical protein [Parachlamydiaceae bacterium]